jgi:hypothetical protein
MLTPKNKDETISGILQTSPVITQSYGKWLGALVMLFALSRHHRRLPIVLAAMIAVAGGARWAGWL